MPRLTALEVRNMPHCRLPDMAEYFMQLPIQASSGDDINLKSVARTVCIVLDDIQNCPLRRRAKKTVHAPAGECPPNLIAGRKLEQVGTKHGA